MEEVFTKSNNRMGLGLKSQRFYKALEKFYEYQWEDYFAVTDQLVANELGYVKDEVYEEI